LERGKDNKGGQERIAYRTQSRGSRKALMVFKLATSRFMHKDLGSLYGGHRQLPVARVTDHSSRYALVAGANLHSVGATLRLFEELGNAGSLTAPNEEEDTETAQKKDTASAEQDIRDPGRVIFIVLLVFFLGTVPCCLSHHRGTVRLPLSQWGRRGRRRGRQLRGGPRRERSFRGRGNSW